MWHHSLELFLCKLIPMFILWLQWLTLLRIGLLKDRWKDSRRFESFKRVVNPITISAYKGKTRNPEKVEYFHPPIRLPLSSLRYALSPRSIITSPALVAASRVTSWSPAKAEITGQPLWTRLTYRKEQLHCNTFAFCSKSVIRLQKEHCCM